MVQQDVFLFSGSIEENVHLWRPQVLASNGEASIRERLASLGLDVSERELELELDERGGNLSAGQRQLLAFERARSQNPRLWILDEATSNIDSETEHRVVSEFDGASRGKTCFLIAHRLATVRTCNRILVLHRGELVECGTHQELIQRDGLYARLYRFQTSSEELETRLAHPDSPQASPAT
jgi:ABC-type multidrug transport system fused ATPase/permease subunit